MLSDIEIAQGCQMRPITEVAAAAGLDADDLELYGKYKAKLSADVWTKVKDKENGKLVLVTAINPTPAGEGKTTMIRLILGLVRPESGSVRLIGADGQCLPVSAATRTAFSYVPQGNTVFAGTIADNLRMVRPEATDAELVAALKTACAYDFVSQLPDGIYARTGELGHGLSEGQAQRIAVARAVLCGAPVLLLDEATSALDEATEQRMLQNLMHSGRVQTCGLIPPRAATAERCRRRYVLRGTRLTEEAAACAL